MTAAPSPYRDFHRRLHHWYNAHGRKDLPWRTTSDPYAIYLSEIMLQQTQVKTVLDRYYFQFLKRFPTLASLAKAPRDEVLKAWQGLGYYNRAANLHETARQCETRLPDSAEALMELPGIGRNTAHAVAAFAYRQPLPVMEANVRRVLSRIFAMAQPKELDLWEKAQSLLDRRNPFYYNQAMMDIGSGVCTKRAPKCGECPANLICKGKTSPESYPAAARKKAPPVRKKNIALFCNAQGEYFARPRESRFLRGLYHFVETDHTAQIIPFQNNRYALANARHLGRIRQQYSHFTLEAEIFLIETALRHGKDWYSPKKLSKLPLSMAEQKILRLLA